MYRNEYDSIHRGIECNEMHLITMIDNTLRGINTSQAVAEATVDFLTNNRYNELKSQEAIMHNIQSFAGTVLNKQDLKTLAPKITEQVLIEILSPMRGKHFVTPEQYVKKYNATHRQVVQVLNGLVKDKVLKPEYKKTLDTGREQSYFYFNMNKVEAENYARSLLKIK